MLQLVRQPKENLELYKFNDMTDHDIDVSPGIVFEELNNFNCEYFNSKLTIESNIEKKYIRMTMEDLDVKVKFFELNNKESDDEDDEVSSRLRMKFVKKRGDLSNWYELFNLMKDTVLEDILLAPEAHHAESLGTCDSDE
jgi:hypothetical protein